MKNSNLPSRKTGFLSKGIKTSTTTTTTASATTTSNANNSSNANISKNTTNNNSRELVCDICAQNVPGPEREKIWAFGKCDHYVCYVCSARMRVICDQSDCPICREKLDSVMFSSNKNLIFEKLNIKSCLYDERYKIYFESKSIKNAFEKLLKFECQECLKNGQKAKTNKKTLSNTKDELLKNSEPCDSGKNKQQAGHNSKEGSDNNRESIESSKTQLGGNQRDNVKAAKGESSSVAERIEEDAQGFLSPKDVAQVTFPDVFGLRNHLNYVHKLKLCDLCLTFNRLFPFEYSYYSSAALRLHMEKGEPKTSHRGHPNCTLCGSAFFNNDELISHMSRDHYFCHLCGRHDSVMRIYFLDYDGLRQHFKTKHYLCERGNCRHEEFTSAFDNKIDYQCHIVQVHGNPTASLSRGESRQQRTITLDSAPHRSRDMSPTHTLRQSLPPNAAIVTTGNIATANSSRLPRTESSQSQLRQQRLPTRAEFPALGQDPSSSTSQTIQIGTTSDTTTQPSNTISTRLVVNSSISQRLAAGPSSSRGSFVRSLGGGLRAAEQLTEIDFPPLPEQPKPKVNKKPKSRQNEPALEQLINDSLTLSNRNPKFHGKKSGSKSGSAKLNKKKLIKIQL